MTYLNRVFSGNRRSLATITIILLLSVSMATPTLKLAADDVKPQTILTIDLSASLSAVNIQVYGAAADDHLSGNGTENTFNTFPRARALAVGDLNADGFDDLIVGAPDVDFTPQGGTLRQNAGAVYVLFGQTTFPNNFIVDTNLPTLLGQPNVRVFGAAAGDNLGFAVAAGDVNGDGADDLIMGAPGADVGTAPNNRDNVGVVYILFGSTSFMDRTTNLSDPNSSNIAIVGEFGGDLFGSSLAVGDVNSGTTPPDLLVGAPGSRGPVPGTTPRADGGAAYALFGGQGLSNNVGILSRTIDLGQGPPNVRIFGRAGSRLGSSVAIGDINSGGAGDLIVGAPTADRPAQGGDIADTGAVYAVFGGSNLAPVAPATSITFDTNTTQQNVSIYGEDANDRLGASVSTGTVNLDGITDLVIGAPDADGPVNSRADAGEAYVITGGTALNPPAGSTERSIIIGLGVASVVIYGAVAGDHFGSSVHIGAINTQGNNDTIPDVIVGAPAALSNRGSVSILFGGTPLFTTPARDVALLGDDVRVLGQADDDELGWALASGDLDFNRGGDLALGAPFADPMIAVGVTRQNAGKVYVLLAQAQNVPPMNENPVVVVTNPNGGNTLQGGSNFEITWTASDANGDNTIQSFEIRLSTDGGATFNTIITSGLAGTARAFTWTVPTGLNTATARIRVIAFDNAGGQGQDDSNANFTITDVGVPVTLTAPNGGENITAGQMFNITWTVPMASASQVRGFDLFFTTDNGVTFTNITPPNPSGPALAADVRTFAWTVPSICSTNVRVAVRATSITNAVSLDLSNGPFSTANPGPQVDLVDSFFNDSGTRIILEIIKNSEPRFLEGARVEISTDQAGTQFLEAPIVKIKANGKRVQLRGEINGQTYSAFIPEGARRIIRITNPGCGLSILRVRRQGQVFVADTAPFEAESITNHGLSNWQ